VQSLSTILPLFTRLCCVKKSLSILNRIAVYDHNKSLDTPRAAFPSYLRFEVQPMRSFLQSLYVPATKTPIITPSSECTAWQRAVIGRGTFTETAQTSVKQREWKYSIRWCWQKSIWLLCFFVLVDDYVKYSSKRFEWVKARLHGRISHETSHGISLGTK
jgi:hypothetical protein